MNIIAIYLLLVLILALLGLVMALNFLRYHFKGDRTVPLLFIFVVLFLGNVILALSQINFNALTPQTETFTSSSF